MITQTLPLSNITAGDFIIVGTDTNLHFARTEEAAKNIIASVISDIVYEEMGGDEEFLYDEDGNVLPDEQIVDSVDEILNLGQEYSLCYIDENDNWAYSGDEDGYGTLQFSIYQII